MNKKDAKIKMLWKVPSNYQTTWLWLKKLYKSKFLYKSEKAKLKK